MAAADLPIVLQLQTDALDPHIPVSNLLRKAKLIAVKLDIRQALRWIDRELNGYHGVLGGELPAYRILKGELKMWNPHHGWQPIIFDSSKVESSYSTVPVGQPLGVIEEMFRCSDDTRIFYFSYPPKRKLELMKAIHRRTNIQLQFNYGQCWSVVDAVRNLVLNWSLELENAGILGDRLSFTLAEKTHAQPVSNQFFAQNIGVIGNVEGHSQVHNTQHVCAKTVELSEIRSLISQLQQYIDSLPEPQRVAAAEFIESAEEELSRPDPNRPRIHRLLQSFKNICEAASGNVVAQGIVTLLKNMIGP